MGRYGMGFARRHPSVLFLYSAGVMIWTMMTRHPVTILLSFVISTVYSRLLLGRGGWKRTLSLAAVLLVFNVFVLPFFSHNGVTPLFYVNGMAVTWESVVYGVTMSAMLLAVFQWCQVASVLLDSEKILFLTGKTVPVIGLLLMMVFQALPRMRDQYRQIHEGQKGLGRDASGLSFWQRGQHLLRELSVLISWALEDSVEISMSMESRGYGTGHRTWFHLFSFQWQDLIWCILLSLGYGGIFFIQFTGGYRAYCFPEIYWEQLDLWAWCALGAGTAMLMAPVFFQLGEGHCEK